MTWQPEPDQGWPDGTASDRDPDSPDQHDQPGSQVRARRGRRRLAAFVALLAVALGGLAVAAVGIAHQLLPRQFTAAQKQKISTWEMERRWRALPAGTIFPRSVSYTVPASALNATSGATLQARLLGISPQTSCATGVSAAVSAALRTHGCSAVLRATYADDSGSLVATVAVVVLPDTAARSVVTSLAGPAGFAPTLVQTLRIAGTPAARFGDAERQLADGSGAGPYVVLATVGFADGRRRVHVPADGYLDAEIASFAQGLVQSARSALGRPPPPPACPGAPGC